MNNLSTLWNDATKEIESRVTMANYSTWFKETSALREDGGAIYVGVPNSFTKEWIDKKFKSLVMEVLEKIEPAIKSVEFVVVRNGIEQTTDTSVDYSGLLLQRIEKLHGSLGNVISHVKLVDTKVVNVCAKVEAITDQISAIRHELHRISPTVN